MPHHQTITFMAKVVKERKPYDMSKRSAKKLEAPPNSTSTPSSSETPITSNTYNPERYKVLTGLVTPTGKGPREIIWPHFPFDTLSTGDGIFIPEDDPNHSKSFIQRAIRQFQAQPKAKIASGANAGKVKDFRIDLAVDPDNPVKKGLILMRTL